MRNLYSITTNQAAIAALFRAISQYVGNLRPCPVCSLIIRLPWCSADGGREMTTMRWGMPPPPRDGASKSDSHKLLLDDFGYSLSSSFGILERPARPTEAVGLGISGGSLSGRSKDNSRSASRHSTFFAHSLTIRLPAVFRSALSIFPTQPSTSLCSSGDIACRVQTISKSRRPLHALNHAVSGSNPSGCSSFSACMKN